MIRRFAFAGFALLAMFCVVVATVSSAAQMAPVGANAPAYQTHVATGGFDDLCGTDDVSHADHDCPFCRLLADPDDLTPVTTVWTLDPRYRPERLVAVTDHETLRQRDVQTRAPPCAV